MDRMTYRITDENRHRLELLRAFAVIGGDTVKFQEIVNRAIEDFFENACDAYMRQPATSESMRRTMADLNPQECRRSRGRS
jgi:hypothetical protein